MYLTLQGMKIYRYNHIKCFRYRYQNLSSEEIKRTPTENYVQSAKMPLAVPDLKDDRIVE